jgi:hypothetical protein
VPARVRHRPTWQLVLDRLDELEQWGLAPPVLVADAGYGDAGEVRQGLDDREVGDVVQVKADTRAYPGQTRPETLPDQGRGQPSQPRYRQPRASVKQLVLQAGPQAGTELIWRRGSKGLQRSRFLALRIRPAGVSPRRQAMAAADRELPVRWLLAEGPVDQPEPIKYWLSNLPGTTPSWSWSAAASCAGGSSRTIGSSRAPLGWTTSRAAASVAGTPRHLVWVAHGVRTLERLGRPKPAASA